MIDSHSIAQILESHEVYNAPLILHKGVFEKDDIDDLIEEIDTNNLIKNFPNKLRKRIFNVSVEVLQNLYHHMNIDYGSDEYSEVIFSIYRSGEHIKILSGNFIEKSEVSIVNENILKINTLNLNQLGELYRSVLDEEGFSDKGGAGLGFIDIARKSGSKIEYEFIEIDNSHNFFILKINVNG